MDNQTISILIVSLFSAISLIAIGYILHLLAKLIDYGLYSIKNIATKLIFKKEMEALEMLQFQFGSEFINSLSQAELDTLIEANKHKETKSKRRR